MVDVLAIRAPFSALGGAVVIVGLFFGLARLVDVRFETHDGASPPFVVEPLRPSVQATPDPVGDHPPPRVIIESWVIIDPPQPVLPRPSAMTPDDTVIDFQPIRYARPGIDERARSRGADGDVSTIIDVRPEYPQRAIAGNIEGWVQVRFSVTALGTVRDAVIVASEPGTVFDDAALKAVARWRYEPRVENGEAVERAGLQTIIRFTLEN